MILIIIIFIIIVLERIINFQKLYFQHNTDVLVTVESYEYVKIYKSIILSKLVKIFNNNNIRYFISDGNLLEYIRGKTNYQDDDIDIRIHKDDMNKLNGKLNTDDDLIIPENLIDWNQIRLNSKNIDELKNYDKYFMDIHVDIVDSSHDCKIFSNVEYIFEEDFKKDKYLGIDVNIPNEKFIDSYLSNLYGKKYKSPLMNFYLIKNIYYKRFNLINLLDYRFKKYL